MKNILAPVPSVRILYPAAMLLSLMLYPLSSSAKENFIQDASQPSASKRLSLDFHNIEVRNALRVIADFAALNLVLSDSVVGNITLKLTNVQWQQALALILQSKDLEQSQTGNILRIASREEWFKQDRQWLEARRHHELQQPLHSETFTLSYRSADDFRKILDERASGGDKRGTLLSERGNLLIDPKTNTLIITDIPPVIEEVRHLLQKTDIPTRQVQIEAQIVEASDSFSRELGLKLAFARYRGKTLVNSTLDNVIRHKQAGETVAEPLLPPGINLPISQPLGSIASLFRAGASTVIGLELQAMQAANKGKVISSPRILTADRTEAIIEEGTQIPYQTSTHDSHSYPRVEFKHASLSLKVTPQISRDDTILMNIQLSKDSPNFGQSVQGSPSIDTKKIVTQVLIENGGTVVIGGIHVAEQDHSTNKVPLLSDIPVLGALFSSQRQAHRRRELLVFITPTIIANSRDEANP